MIITIALGIIAALVILAAGAGILFLLFKGLVAWRYNNFKGAGWLLAIAVFGVLLAVFH